MSSVYEGFFVGYFTAEFGTSMGLFVLKDCTLVGADIGGGLYDADLAKDKDINSLSGAIRFRMPNGGVTITGAQSELPVQFEVNVTLQLPLDGPDFHTIESPAGAVNVRFEKLRGL